MTILSVHNVSIMTNWHVDFYICLAIAYRYDIDMYTFYVFMNEPLASGVFNDLGILKECHCLL